MKYIIVLLFFLQTVACNSQPTKKPKGYKLDIVPVMSNGQEIFDIVSKVDEYVRERSNIRDSLYNYLKPNTDNINGVEVLKDDGIIGFAQEKNIAALDSAFKRSVGNYPPFRNFSLTSAYFPDNNYKMYPMYLCYMASPHQIKGEHVKSIEKNLHENGTYEIDITFNEEGAKLFERLTAQASGEIPKGGLAIIANGKVVSCPMVFSKISGGKASITGNFSSEEIDKLIETLSVY